MNIQYIIFLIFCLFSCKQKSNEQIVSTKNSLVKKTNNDTILKNRLTYIKNTYISSK